MMVANRRNSEENKVAANLGLTIEVKAEICIMQIKLIPYIQLSIITTEVMLWHLMKIMKTPIMHL